MAKQYASKAPLKPREGEEVWEMTVPGTIYLKVTTHNRFGQPIESELSVGPNKQGYQFRIKTEDREENQNRASSVELDWFRNGTLVRRDADQQQDEDTASEMALSTEQLLDLLDDPFESFKMTVLSLNEVVLRRLLAVAESMNASHRQVEFLQDTVRERFSKGGLQPALDDSITDPKAGERIFG